ncbi:RNI-like protein [Suillus decipiens]|nr:RNI-like protein [Suillus decipiens]
MAIPITSRSTIASKEILEGTEGAHTIISQLNSSRSITKLKLNNNRLGDDGVSALFTYLKSPAASRHRSSISEIHLNDNGIGCRGLRHIADYVNGNEVALKTLWLANNTIEPDTDVLAWFATTVNHSRLEFLSLTGNHKLGDAVVEIFFRHLRAPYLRELHINTMGLTARCASALAKWISSGHTGGAYSLHTLKCNGNNLGIKGVWEVIHAIETGNWSLMNVEMYANQPAGIENDSSPIQQSGHLPSSEMEVSWKDAEHALRRVLHRRNAYWKRQVELEALSLLKYSRTLILRSKASLSSADEHPISDLTSKSFPFHNLPMELRLHILAVLAPSLSCAQRTRIYDYAADLSTLPQLLPRLRRDIGRGCVADPSRALGASVGFTLYSSGGCAEGKCMGTGNSLVCRRDAERAKFLEAVGCRAYEPECVT